MKKMALILLVAVVLGSCIYVLTTCNSNDTVSDEDFELYCGKWQVAKYETKEGVELSAKEVEELAKLFGSSEIIDYIHFSKTELSYADSFSKIAAKISGTYSEYSIVAWIYYTNSDYDVHSTEVVDNGICIEDSKLVLENDFLILTNDNVKLYLQKQLDSDN